MVKRPTYRPRPAATLPELLARAQAAWSAARFAEAEAAWAAAEPLVPPGDTTLRFNRAAALKNLGRVEAASAIFRDLAGTDRRIEALCHLADLTPQALTAADEAELEAALGDPALPADQAIAVPYTLGRLRERRGDYDPAFAAFALGAERKRATLGGEPAAAALDEARTVADLKTLFTADFNRHHQGKGSPLANPIFVVGLPRSGTTLVEQILATHPKVQGMGESDILRTVLTGQYPYVTLAPAGPDHFRRLADAYLKAMHARGWGASARFVDKTPASIWAVGAIHLMFPKAVILHTVRDPVDTCLSNFQQLFQVGNPLSYDLADLGGQYRRYREAMDHWRAVLPPGRIVDVVLEDLVADPDARIRWLVTEAAGLAWNDACLRFYDNPRTVTTASAGQVRRPIFTTSTGRWRRYATHLGPLFEALGPYAPDGAGGAG